MGHRHLPGTPRMFEGEEDRNWNHMHVEQPYASSAARVGPTENNAFFYPVDSMSVDGPHFASCWNPVPMTNGYISSSHGVEASHYQPAPSGPSHDPFVHLPTAGSFCTVPENYAHHASSSNYGGHTYHGNESGFVDLGMGYGRGPHKRKSPGIPSVFERGSTSRFYGAGSSSDVPLPSELQPEKPNLDPQYMPWECITMNPGYQGDLSLRPEVSTRNVRSRPAIDLETMGRTHLSSNPSHCSYSAGHPIEPASSVDLSGQTSSALAHQWSHPGMPPPHGRIVVADASGVSHDTNHYPVVSSMNNPPVDSRGHHDFTFAPQSLPGSSTHSVRGIRSSYSQRSSPAFRASSSSLHLSVAPSDEELHSVAESYSSRQPGPPPTIPWRNNERSGRSRISYERYRSLSNEAGLHDRFSSEGFMVVDRSAFHGSRNMLDQYRDMRLDVDNMTYEELLALGERIGSVNTGLSEDQISKCLKETVNFSADQMQEDGSCVICLEEYEEMDYVGVLKTCGHDFHGRCIRKWLSMKNSCPICKAAALADNLKEQ